MHGIMNCTLLQVNFLHHAYKIHIGHNLIGADNDMHTNAFYTTKDDCVEQKVLLITHVLDIAFLF